MGNKSSFIPATTDAKVGLAKGLERATAAIAKAPVHDWKRAEVSDGKNHWIVSGDAPRGGGDRGPASSALDAHIELEQAMAASRKKVSAAGEASDYERVRLDLELELERFRPSAEERSGAKRAKRRKEKQKVERPTRREEEESEKAEGPQGDEATQTQTGGPRSLVFGLGFREGPGRARLRGIRKTT